MSENEYWEYQDHDVGEDIDAGVCEPQSCLTNAVSWRCGIPELVDWNASPDASYNARHSIERHERHGSPNGVMHILVVAYSFVLEENGELDGDEC